jgi:hypothetical protein
MNTVRFITADEVDFIRHLYSIDRRSVGIEFTDEKIDRIVNGTRNLINQDICAVPMVFDPSGEPIGMYLGYDIPRVGGWFVGLTKVLHSSNHFNITAPMLAPALNMLIERMENKGYYKWWMGAPESWHNIRNKIMRRHSYMLDRYDWVDEDVIPRGQTSPVDLYNAYSSPCDWSDITIRMFSLRQEHRVAHLKQRTTQDYRGTVLSVPKEV